MLEILEKHIPDKEKCISLAALADRDYDKFVETLESEYGWEKMDSILHALEQANPVYREFVSTLIKEFFSHEE